MKNTLLFLITIYQRIIAPMLHQIVGIKGVCRSNPRCSVYAKEAINKYGAAKGLLLSLRRVVNCQPFFSI